MRRCVTCRDEADDVLWQPFGPAASPSAGCVACGGVRMAGRRVCGPCYNARCRARYASPRPLARTTGHRTARSRGPDESWCWWCQEPHHRRFFARHAGRRSGVAAVCKDGQRTLYRLRTLGTRRVPARGHRRGEDTHA